MVLGAAAWRRAVSVVEDPSLRCRRPEGMVVTLVPALWAAMTASQGARGTAGSLRRTLLFPDPEG